MDYDSDFYGDEPTVSSLHKRVASLDIPAWWHARDDALMLPAARKALANSSPNPSHLHNILEGVPGARQLTETVDEFLSRLPPATTDFLTTGLPWLWIANPYLPREPQPQIDLFISGGTERLRLLSDFISMTQAKNAAKSPFAGRQQIGKERAAAAQDLRDLAVECGVVCGKWMLFPEPGAVNRVWGAVAQATANGELGPESKVDTRKPGDDGKERLICVYTRDFRDKDDVARVLNRLRRMELVRDGGKQIYWKSDAWTHLGIYGKNEWNIPASTFSSKEIFAYIKERGLKK
ncbi:hypothetical protein QBC39DRAFT_315996 [Podospora conica]|nr:hypothetical protein QBC39DRAFT_315996 [Schizothecium conicum]